jgi:protein-disulfide isomerase
MFSGTRIMTTWRRVPAAAGAAVLAALLGLGAAACGSSSPTAPSQPVTLPTLAEMLAEKSIGSSTAPVTMVAYSSLACPFCASFELQTLPQIKSNYIDTGKVKYVFRDYPLGFEGEGAIAAAMVARCSGSAYFSTVDRLFQNQAAWANAGDYKGAIKGVVSGIGLSSAFVDACLVVPGLRDGILANRAMGDAQGVTGTPTFFINTQKVVGAQPYATFAAIIDSM